MGSAKSSASRVGGKPAVEEAVDPAIERRIVERVHAEMHAALLGAGKFQALGSLHGPDLFHLERDLGMELEAEGAATAAEALHRIALAGGEQLAAIGDGHPLAMPLVDFHRRFDPVAAGFCRFDAGIARHVFGQLAAKVGAKAVEVVTAFFEQSADPAGPRMLLMNHNRYFFGL